MAVHPCVVWEDFRHTVSLCLATMTMADLPMNPQSYPDRKAAYTKAIQQMAGLGVSKADLAQEVRAHVDEFLASCEPEEAQPSKRKGRADKAAAKKAAKKEKPEKADKAEKGKKRKK